MSDAADDRIWMIEHEQGSEGKAVAQKSGLMQVELVELRGGEERAEKRKGM